MAGSAASLEGMHADPERAGQAHAHADAVESLWGQIMQVFLVLGVKIKSTYRLRQRGFC